MAGASMMQRACRVLLFGLMACAALPARSHGVDEGDAAFIAQSAGVHLVPFMYLGAKHMVTGFDHLLFLFGVVFFLQRGRDIVLYVSLFAAGHSVTLLLGVLGSMYVNAWLVDAVIGLSVAYKALDNLGGWHTLFKRRPDPRHAVFAFGLIHGFGLAVRLQDMHLARQGLLPNLAAFHVGIEVGQLLALAPMLLLLLAWRRHAGFHRQATLANGLLLIAGITLFGYQLAGYLIERGYLL